MVPDPWSGAPINIGEMPDQGGRGVKIVKNYIFGALVIKILAILFWRSDQHSQTLFVEIIF